MRLCGRKDLWGSMCVKVYRARWIGRHRGYSEMELLPLSGRVHVRARVRSPPKNKMIPLPLRAYGTDNELVLQHSCLRFSRRAERAAMLEFSFNGVRLVMGNFKVGGKIASFPPKVSL